MDVSFCLAALEEALAKFGRPEIFNTDQGSLPGLDPGLDPGITSAAFTGALAEAGVAISMDGRGRWMDNVFIERLWRSLKHEDVYLKGTPTAARPRAESPSGSPSTTSGARTRRLDTAPMTVWREATEGKGCGHDGQRFRVAHMPTAAATDAASRCVIERNTERSDFQRRTEIKRSRCAGPFLRFDADKRRCNALLPRRLNRQALRLTPHRRNVIRGS